MYLTGKTIDVVQMGLSVSKMALIITDKEVEMKPRILSDLDLGLTQLKGLGGYTEDERPILLCVLSPNKISGLKQLVRSVDPKAFVIVTNATEVLGEGFKHLSK
jgi:uncharacterized membrane-anchored protein YitT (DUF2179 family)